LPASCAAAVETALADLLARRAGVPLHALLAPGRSRPPRAVPVAALLPHTSLQEMVEGAFRAIGRGVRTLKAKLGPGGETVELCARLEVLRRKVGMDIALRADINGAWPLEQAGELMHMLATSGGPELCEQPVAPPHLASLPDPPLPIAADESLMYETAREEALERAPISAVVLKPMTLGGLRASLDLARRARERGLDVIVSHLHGGPVAHAMACELALALDPPPLPCGLDTGPALDALGGPPPQWRAAWIVPVDRPGLGIDTDRPEAGA
ncbi:MAG: O-succinylbenzoate synthase, partial [Acidobacteria bacterium]